MNVEAGAVRAASRTRVDPITAAVIGGALENIAIEMGHKLMRMSYSSIIRESEDFGAALTDADGQPALRVQDEHAAAVGTDPRLHPRHQGDACRAWRRHPPGDVIMHNDPVRRRLARSGRGVLRAGVSRRRS